MLTNVVVIITSDWQPSEDDNIPPPLWREEYEYHTTTVEDQMPDTNLGMEDLEDTAANINVVLTAGQHSRHNMARPSPTPSHLDHCCCQPDQDTSIRRAPVLGPSSRAPIMDMLNNIVMLIFIICFRSAFQYISQCFPVFNLSVSDMVAERLRLREGMIAI